MTPKTFRELFAFYNDYVKLLYSNVEAQNKLPDETLFEINAAFDHLSRHHIYNESEKSVVEKAFSHLKRSCLDIFKLKVKKALDQYEELKKLDLSYLDNGQYEGKLTALIHEIKSGAIDARHKEGDARYDDEHDVKAFDRWQPVFHNATRLEQEFYLHPRLEWAKRKNSFARLVSNWKTIVLSLSTSYLAGLITTKWASDLITKCRIGFIHYAWVLLVIICVIFWVHLITHFKKPFPL